MKQPCFSLLSRWMDGKDERQIVRKPPIIQS